MGGKHHRRGRSKPGGRGGGARFKKERLARRGNGLLFKPRETILGQVLEGKGMTSAQTRKGVKQKNLVLSKEEIGTFRSAATIFGEENLGASRGKSFAEDTNRGRFYVEKRVGEMVAPGCDGQTLSGARSLSGRGEPAQRRNCISTLAGVYPKIGWFLLEEVYKMPGKEWGRPNREKETPTASAPKQ